MAAGPQRLRVVGVAAVAIGALAATASPAASACRISTADGVAFGLYDIFSPTPLDSLGRVVVTCWPPSWVQIDLSRGQSPTFFPRRLTGGGAGSSLAYNLYLDAARTIVWGDGTGATQVFRDHGRTVSAFIYGRIPALQDVAAGGYADQITVVIQF